MTFTIIPLAPPAPLHNNGTSEPASSDPDDEMQDSLPHPKRQKLSSKEILTPGELVTDDPQWMR